MRVVIASLVAAGFASLPIAAVWLLRAGRRRKAWEIGLDVPMAVALGLLLETLLARLVVLDLAVWVGMLFWLALCVYAIVRRRSSWRPPRLWGALLRAAGIGIFGLAVSLTLSRPCALWDRQWHIPLVASLRGQYFPFANVYEPGKALYYHYGGHILAASFQALSFGVLHASHALSLAHDFCFFWLGVSLSLTLESLGVRRVLPAIVLYGAMLLSGPVPALSGDATGPVGYSFTNFLSMSFRPHVCLAALLMLPFVAIVMIRCRGVAGGEHRFGVFPLLAAVSAALLFVDECSLGLLALALGGAWLFCPHILGKTRRQGLAVLGGLVLVVLGGIALFGGTLGPGTPHYLVEFVTPSSPGSYTPAIPLTDPLGRRYFFWDLLPVLGTLAGGALLFGRLRDRFLAGTWAFHATLTLASLLLFATLFYAGSGRENHRFVTAAMLYSPLIGGVWLVPRLTARPLPRISLGALVVVIPLALAAGTTFEWLAGGQAIAQCRHAELFFGSDTYYRIDCRTETAGGVVTRPTQPTYAEGSIFYLYAGCRPLYAPGPVLQANDPPLKAGNPQTGAEGLLAFDRDRSLLGANAPLPVACPPKAVNDPVCSALVGSATCRGAGTGIRLCEMSAAERRRLADDISRARQPQQPPAASPVR